MDGGVGGGGLKREGALFFLSSQWSGFVVKDITVLCSLSLASLTLFHRAVLACLALSRSRRRKSAWGAGWPEAAPGPGAR